MKRKNYRSETKYRKAKKKENQRYYSCDYATGKYKKWSPDEETFILTHTEMTIRQLAKALGRSVKSTEHKKQRLFSR